MKSNSFAYALPGCMVTKDAIIRLSASQYGLDPQILYSKDQKGQVSESRGMAMFFIRKTFKLSYARTGFTFSTDHSGVEYWVKKILTLCEIDKQTRLRFIQVGHKIGLTGEQINNYLTGK